MPFLVFLLLFIFSAGTLAAQNPPQFGRITLLFAGDLMQHQAQIDAARQWDGSYDYTECFSQVRKEVSRADLAIANLEVTLAGKPYRGYPQFSAPDEYAVAIKKAGFDILLTANNHSLDRRRKGLERTIQVLDSLDIPHLGTYSTAQQREENYPFLIERNGFRIVLLNYTYGTNGISVTPPNVVNYIDKELIRKDIQKAHAMHPDLIIANMHWGREYRLLPDKQERELADWLIAQGVDHVIGSHPHVLQPMELRTDSLSPQKHLVVYSLGNYLSNMSALHTDGGAMVRMEFQKLGPVIRLVDCAYSLVWTSRPIISSKTNYVVYPAANPPQDMTPTEKLKLNTFLENARNLFNHNNIGVGEYFFK